jgi:hypothetical protein
LFYTGFEIIQGFIYWNSRFTTTKKDKNAGKGNNRQTILIFSVDFANRVEGYLHVQPHNDSRNILFDLK